jgi:hypothetical protein
LFSSELLILSSAGVSVSMELGVVNVSIGLISVVVLDVILLPLPSNNFS